MTEAEPPATGADPPRITFEIVTLFPELFDGLLGATVVGKAVAAGVVAVHRTNPRDFAPGRYRQVDDTPYGGGPGMVMRVEPIAAALDAIAAARGPSRRILLTPRGRLFDQAGAATPGRAPRPCSRRPPASSPGCSAAASPPTRSRSPPGGSSTRSGPGRRSGTGRRCRTCCSRAITRPLPAGAGPRRPV